MSLFRWLPVLGTLLLIAGGPVAEAQNLNNLLKPKASASPGTEAPKSTEDQQKQAAAKLDTAKAARQAMEDNNLAARVTSLGLPDTTTVSMKAAADEIVRNYQSALDTLTGVINSERELTAREAEEAPAPPQTEEAVEKMRQQLAALRQRSQSARMQAKLDENLLDRQKTAADNAAQQFRRASEAYDASADADKPKATLALEEAKLKKEAADSGTFLLSWRLYADDLQTKITDIGIRNLESALTASGLDTIFNQQRAEAALAQIEQNRQAIEKQILGYRETARTLQETIKAQREKLTALGDGAPAEQKAPIERKIALATDAASFADRLLRAAELQLAGLETTANCWKAAIEVVKDPSATNLAKARDLSAQILEDISMWRDEIRRNIEDGQKKLDDFAMEEGNLDGQDRKLDSIRRDLVRQRASQLRDTGDLVENLDAIASQLNAESRQKLSEQSIAEKASQGVERFQDTILKIWNTEIFTTEDHVLEKGQLVPRQRGVSLGKILIAVSTLAFGYFLCRIASRGISNHIRRRYLVDSARAIVVEKAIFVPLVVLLFLTTLSWLHIPITAFAFLGGALAIGIGFGVQTLMNNFISGMILLAERRIKVGDIIEIDGHLGRVTGLGTRCSNVQKFDGVEVLVPNSYFLEKNVVNWTLSDPHHRYDFIVGVAYGSPLDKVMQLFQQALKEQPQVMESPASRVFFESFGDNSLNFHFYYWLDVRTADTGQVGSDIRMRIERLCRENGIEIAYPQRDIHLRTSTPIQVEVLK